MKPRLLAASALLLSALVTSPAFGRAPDGVGDWPQWRGPNRDGVSTETGLLKSWPEDGPRVVWRAENVGVGYASIAVRDGRIYTQGDLDGVEHVICLDAADGRTLWAIQPEPVAKALAERVAEEMKKADADGDGRLSEAEALRRFGWKLNDYDRKTDGETAPIAEARTERLFAALDADGDGRLDSSEVDRSFRNEFPQIDRRDEEADADELARSRTAALLKEFDADGDGRLSREEARESLLDGPFGRIDQKDPDTDKNDRLLSAEEIEKYLAEQQPGQDGVLTTAEVQRYFAEKQAGKDGMLTADELRTAFGGYRNGRGDGPRGTPTLDGNRLYAEGGNGDLSCLDAATGRTIWHVNLADLDGRRPGWGYCESPLVLGEMLIVTPGGKSGTLAALDKSTGEVIWRSDDVTQGAHYSSPIAAEIGGVRQIVQFARENVFGVRADDGRLMWQYERPANGTANCATPIVHQDHVFASSGYGTGGGVARITGVGDEQTAEEVWFEGSMANHHGGVVRVGDYLYGFGNNALICMHFLTGEIAWRDRSVGKGSLVVADSMLYLLSEGHKVALAEATPEEYREHGRFEIESHGRPSWAHPVVAGGRLYIRDQNTLTAYDVRASQAAE